MPPAIQRFEVDPDMNGDFYVEINQGHPTSKNPGPPGNGGYTYRLFDITVADPTTNTIKEGRVWAKRWALSTGNQGQLFNAKLYVLRQDSIRFEIDYNGIDPYGFGIISNSYGINNTGNFKTDRKSTSQPTYTQGTVPYLAEHKIFLNKPDESVYPYPTSLPSLSVASPTGGTLLITGCITSGYCINVSTTKPGQAEVKLDLDAVPGYQPGGRDVLVTGVVGSGAGCVPWDGLDGFGDTALSANIEINYKYEAGLVHIPVYDAENHANGYKFTLISGPLPTDTTAMKLYWDDSNFNSNQTSGINLNGCNTPCRNWISNYGNERFLNTWSFAFDQTLTLSNVKFEFCPPEVRNDSVQVNKNSSVTIIPMSNDIAPLNKFDLSTFQITCNPKNGSYNLMPNRHVVYTPNKGFFGRDTICYEVCDTNNPSSCNTGLMLIDVLNVNTGPGATTVNGKPVTNNTSDSITTPEDTPIQICLQWIDYEGDSITLSSSLGTPSHGSLQNFIDGDSCFTYVPNPDYFGRDTLRIQLCDNAVPVTCDIITIPIVVTPVNDPPKTGGSAGGVPIINDTIKVITTNEDTPVQLCFNGTDVDGDKLSVTQLVSAPAHGVTTNVTNGDSCFTYTPNFNYNGPDTLTITICDDGAPSLCNNIYCYL